MRAGGGKGGHWFLVLKGNQPTLRQEVRDLWLEGVPSPDAVTTNKGHGRVEVRRLWTSTGLRGHTEWPHLAQACRVEREVTSGRRTTVEVEYAATSLTPTEASPDQLLALWRGHWGIENRVHWIRDVTFDEDRSQVRTGAAPQALAALRNVVLNLVRTTPAPSVAAALRRYAWRPDLALQLVGIRDF